MLTETPALHPTNITATTLPDAWFQALYACLEHGREHRIDRGSYAGQRRLELDWITIHIHQPHLRDRDGWPLLPEIPAGVQVPPPCERDYLAEYARYIMTPERQPGEQYTYGQRLWAADACPSHGLAGTPKAQHPRLDQVSEIIRRLRSGPRVNQCVLQIAHPADLELEDPPCLRHIDTRIQDGALHFFPYFRSWDLWGGMPANLAGLSILQEYMAAEIGVTAGQFIATSKGLHLYDYAVPFAKLRCLQRARGAN